MYNLLGEEDLYLLHPIFYYKEKGEDAFEKSIFPFFSPIYSIFYTLSLSPTILCSILSITTLVYSCKSTNIFLKSLIPFVLSYRKL